MNCAKHPEKEAAGMCVYCGKPHCADCLVEVDGKMYCREDLTNVLKDAKQHAANTAQPAYAPPPININNVNTNLNTNTNVNAGAYYGPRKSKMVALILCLLGFVGLAGLHRFYVGKIGSGLIYLFTGGIFFIGTVIDLLLIITGSFRDKYGMPLI
jgi:hypothetical protein